MSRKYPNSDRAFGEPPLFSCTDSYKRVLEAHLTEAVAKITRTYEVGTTHARGELPLRVHWPRIFVCCVIQAPCCQRFMVVDSAHSVELQPQAPQPIGVKEGCGCTRRAFLTHWRLLPARFVWCLFHGSVPRLDRLACHFHSSQHNRWCVESRG